MVKVLAKKLKSLLSLGVYLGLRKDGIDEISFELFKIFNYRVRFRDKMRVFKHSVVSNSNELALKLTDASK